MTGDLRSIQDTLPAPAAHRFHNGDYASGTAKVAAGSPSHGRGKGDATKAIPSGLRHVVKHDGREHVVVVFGGEANPSPCSPIDFTSCAGYAGIYSDEASNGCHKYNHLAHRYNPPNVALDRAQTENFR